MIYLYLDLHGFQTTWVRQPFNLGTAWQNILLQKNPSYPTFLAYHISWTIIDFTLKSINSVDPTCFKHFCNVTLCAGVASKLGSQLWQTLDAIAIYSFYDMHWITVIVLYACFLLTEEWGAVVDNFHILFFYFLC